jgi:hypothetical protein
MYNFVDVLISLSKEQAASVLVRQIVWDYLLHLKEIYTGGEENYLLNRISKYLASPNEVNPSSPLPAPDGSPIGMDNEWLLHKILQCTNSH